MQSDTNRKGLSAQERFWRQVNKTDRCWFWTGGRNAGGYGTVMLDGIKWIAHRAAYAYMNGPIPDALRVLHDCDKFYQPGDISYRLCVRPDHLFQGTDIDNMLDRDRKGRQAKGSRNGMAKLDEEQIVEIRHRYKEGDVSQRHLGEEYGVTQEMISAVVRNNNWKCVETTDYVKRPYNVGEKNGSRKLTAEQVLEIRRRYRTGVITQRELAAEFGVSGGQLSAIVRGVKWKHLLMPPLQ